MGLFDKALKTFGYVSESRVQEIVEKTVGPLIDDNRIYRSLRSLLSEQGSSVTAPYKQSVWVYSAISAISQNLQRVPFLLRKDAGTLEPDIVESGPLYDLFLNPNPLMTLKTLIEATFVYFGLRGEAFWIIEGRDNITQIPKEIWTFDPIRFDPVTDPNTGMLVGWKYKGKKEYTFPLDQVIHFKEFNPYDDLRGIAPIEAIRLSVEQDYQSGVYNKAFFENGAKVGGFITIPAGTDLTDEQFDRLVKQFEDRHKGASKSHKIAVVEGGGTFAEAKITQKDMDFIEGKKLTRTEILAAYKVNEVVLGIYTEVKSFLGVQAAHKAFWEECLMPKIEYFQEVLWAKFFSNIGVRRGRGRIWGEFDLANVGPLQVNYQDKVKTAMSMFHMGWPINDINKRLQLGMKEVPWGDQWWVPGGFLPVSSLVNGAPEKSSEEPVVEDSKGKIVAPFESEFKSKVKTLLFNQRKRAIAEAFSGRDWSLVHSDKEYSKFKESLYYIYRDALNCGIFYVQQQGMDDVIPMKELALDISTYAESRSVFISKGFQKVITEAFSSLGNNGVHKEVLGDKVRDIYNLLSSKSSVMAKSEMDAAFNQGKNFASRYIRDALYPSLGLSKGEIKLLK